MSILWMFSNVYKICVAANTPLDKHTIFEVKKLLETTWSLQTEFYSTELKPNVNQKRLHMRIKGQ